MPSVIAANIEVATPSGMTAQPITANLITTASKLGNRQNHPNRHQPPTQEQNHPPRQEPPKNEATKNIPASDQSRDCICVVTMLWISVWLTATSPAKPSLIPSGARCSRS